MSSSSNSGSSSGSSSTARRDAEEEEGKKCCGHSHAPAVPGGSKEGGSGWVRPFLQKFTVAASILCAIDCTVLPALIAVVSAYDVVGPETHEALGWNLHELSHQAALYVVLPIGAFLWGFV